MTLTLVSPTSTDIRYTASVDVKFSGFHIGGGIYFSANHNPSPGGSHTAVPQQGLDSVQPSQATIEYDYTLPADTSTWSAYLEDTNNDGTLDFIRAGFDMAMEVQNLSSGATKYSGPSVPLLIANEPSELYGTVTITGYPNAFPGDLYTSTGTLYADNYTEQNVNGDIGGYYTIIGAEALSGMSGGPNYLEFDANEDGVVEIYAIGTSSRVGTATIGPPPQTVPIIQSTSFSPHYAELASAIQSLTGANIRTADDFARMTLLSAQTAGSTNTTVQGQFFHEDIFGGVNADILYGAGGDDLLAGRQGADFLNAGSGDDILTGGSGDDWFDDMSFGNGNADLITDFSLTADVIDLARFFNSLDAVIAATIEQPDGSIIITLPANLGGGTVQVANTTIAQLSTTNVNVICFASGTWIETITGPRRIETLRTGDLIAVHGDRYQPLRGINRRTLGPQELRDRPNLWPVTIQAGALGFDTPDADLTVSPQHRIIIDSPISQRMTGGPVLVSAIKLVMLDGVSQTLPAEGITYFHLLFDRHQVILSNACWSESFFPGDMAMQSLSDDIRAKYAQIFRSDTASAPAFPTPSGRRIHHMLARHVKNNKALQTVTPRQGGKRSA